MHFCRTPIFTEHYSMAASIYSWFGNTFVAAITIIVLKTAVGFLLLNLWQENQKMKKFPLKVICINFDRRTRLKKQFCFYRDFCHFGDWKIDFSAY